MMNKNVHKLSKENLLYVSKTKWNGDFDGSMLQMTVDKYLPRFVRIGVKNEEVYFFNKKAFLNHLEGQSLLAVEKAEKEWQDDDCRDCEYEAFFEACEPLIDSFEKVEGLTLYINAFDFIREVAVPVLKDIKWD